MVIGPNFKEQNSGKANIIDALSRQTLTKDGTCLYHSLNILLEYEVSTLD
jgi:hypothetical protein